MSHRVHTSVSIFAALAIVCGLGFTAPSSVQATELTLDDCIKLALANRASIIRARGDEELAKAGKRAALGAFLPRIGASYDISSTKLSNQEGEVVDSLGNITTQDFEDSDLSRRTLAAGATASLLDVTAFFYDVAIASANRERARLDVIGSEQDLIYSVKLAYYEYLVNAQNISVQQEAVKRSEEQLKLIQSRFDLGSASLSDVLKQKVQVGSDRLELLRAQNSVTTSKADLAFTIGVDPRQEWSFATSSTPREYPGTLNEAIDYGLTHQPSLLAGEYSVKIAKKEYSSAKSTYFPRLSASAGLEWSKEWAGDPELMSSGSSRTVGIGLDWTIFDGFQRERSVTSAKVAHNNAKAAQADLRNQTISNIKSVYSEIEILKEQTKVANESVEAATEDLKITQEKYNLGAATILDLLESQVSLKRAQVQQLQVGFNLNLAVARLENATGKY